MIHKKQKQNILTLYEGFQEYKKWTDTENR